MKKMINKFNMAIIGAMFCAPAFADVVPSGICGLIHQMYNVLSIMRTLVFVGAAFTIAGWAWGYISGGKAELKDVQGKGVGLMVGFILLFSIGMILQFLMSTSGAKALGCPEILNW